MNLRLWHLLAALAVAGLVVGGLALRHGPPSAVSGPCRPRHLHDPTAARCPTGGVSGPGGCRSDDYRRGPPP